MVLRLKDCYGTWQQYLQHFPKSHRFTIGSKVDVIFLESIELSFLASYSSGEEKLSLVGKTISKVDLLKLLLQLAWEVTALDNKKYVHLSEQLDEIGKMLGGWKRQLINKNSHPSIE